MSGFSDNQTKCKRRLRKVIGLRRPGIEISFFGIHLTFNFYDEIMNVLF